MILSEHPDNDNYGVLRIQAALLQAYVDVILRTVYRTMKEGNLIHKQRKPHGIMKSITEIQEKENLIKRDFSVDSPFTKRIQQKALSYYVARFFVVSLAAQFLMGESP